MRDSLPACGFANTTEQPYVPLRTIVNADRANPNGRIQASPGFHAARAGVWFRVGWILALLLFSSASHAVVAPALVWHPERFFVMPAGREALRPLEQFHLARGRVVLREFPGLGGLQVVRVAAGESVAEAVRVCRTHPLVAWAEPDYRVSAAGTFPNDPYFQNGTQWALNNYGQNGGLPDADLDAPEAWDVLRAASNVVVAVVDSGIRSTHEDLAANLWQHPLDGAPGFNALTGQHDPWDDNGHGTHVAGIIAAVGNNGRGVAGVAWGVQLMACKFLDASGNGHLADAIACIEFARSNGAHVLNLSWGGGEFSAALSNALWAARAQGIVVAAAAGNLAANTDLTPYYPASLPLDNVVAVGASTRTDDRWSLSNYGANSVDLFAPGAAIFSTASSGDAAYQSRDGTSMATAFVSGALALLRQARPEASPADWIARLRSSADVKSAFVGRCVSGGRLNLRRALDLPALALSLTNGLATVRVTGQPGHRYVITASTNLAIWTAIQTNTTGTDGQWGFPDPASTLLPARFYRAEPEP